MSLKRIKKEDYFCQNCQAVFIPLNVNYPCPNCCHLSTSEEYVDFIDQLLASMKVHRNTYGSYMPGAWVTTFFAEHVQLFCFKIFDALEMENLDTEEDERRWIKEIIENQTWNGTLYIKPNMSDVLFAVYEKYLAHNRLKETWTENVRRRFFKKLAKLLP